MYYQTKFRYEYLDEVRLKTIKKTCSLLIEAETFGDAEEATFQYCETYGKKNPDIFAVSRSPIREVANGYQWEEGKPSWIVTMEDNFITEDGKDKKLKYPVLFWADEMPSANDQMVINYRKGIDPSGYTMHVVGVKKSDIAKEV